MSDTLSAGKSFDLAFKIQESKCDDSPDSKHDWETHGTWPSIWKECRHCKEAIFFK